MAVFNGSGESLIKEEKQRCRGKAEREEERGELTAPPTPDFCSGLSIPFCPPVWKSSLISALCSQPATGQLWAISQRFPFPSEDVSLGVRESVVFRTCLRSEVTDRRWKALGLQEGMRQAGPHSLIL